MKNLSILLIVFLMFSFQESEQKISEEKVITDLSVKDKAFLFDYYEKTSENLKKATKGLSEKQLNYKPSEDRWSVSQCLEHIILTEQAIFGMTQELMAQPASPERKPEIKTTDQDLISGMEDRSQKAQAPEELQPVGKYNEAKVALKEFKEQREKIQDFLKENSEEDLRNHIGNSPFGPIDAYQSCLFIAAHTARHTKQIEELLADRGFPSK